VGECDLQGVTAEDGSLPEPCWVSIGSTPIPPGPRPLQRRSQAVDHIVVFNEDHLRRILRSCFSHYRSWRTHLALDMDCPEPRDIQGVETEEIIEIAGVGGLHHHYERLLGSGMRCS